MPARYVRPYSKGQNDFRDAEAIAEAVQRPTMKFVVTKTADQLDLQALHRVRERLVSQRTGIINQIRAFLLERGIAVRQGQRFLRVELPRILATPPDVLSPAWCVSFRRGLLTGIGWMSASRFLKRDRGACQTGRRMRTPDEHPRHRTDHLQRLVAAIGTGDSFSKGRDFAAWLGLVPRQISTGDRTISAQYRSGESLPARPVRAGGMGRSGKSEPTRWQGHGLRPWIEAAKKRLHHNVLAIALANKLARIAWSVLAHGRAFETNSFWLLRNRSR